MNPADIPLVGPVLRSGARDRVFELLLGGPVLVASIAVVGYRKTERHRESR